jgi:transcriptional regulator with PAS, ATPase and Fis domain/CHASE2 domain-containing sensor protein
MDKFINKYKLYLKIFILLLSFTLLYLFKGFGAYSNRQIENLFYLLGGEKQPDTNIVIIHITDEDIQKFGEWPLKRSYYALLIDQLNKLHSKKIGLEIFLSPKINSQSIYDDLLNSEIQRSGNVVLSSILDDFDESTMKGKIQFPEPKSEVTNLKTGHIDFLDKEGIFIPLNIEYDEKYEPAFSLALSGLENKYKDVKEIKVNFLSGWKKFKNYSLLEFFSLAEKKNPELKNIYDKIVIIGVSDELIARTVSSAFEDRIPGVGLHAFALDNLLDHRYIKTSLFSVSAFVIVLVLSAFVLIEPKRRIAYKYVILGFGFVLISFVLFYYFYFEFHYSLFLFPFVLLVGTEITAYFFERKAFLSKIISESDYLRTALEKKESQLLLLQKELEISGENAPNELVEKVSHLKTLVENYKTKQADEIVAEYQAVEDNTKNFFGIVYRSKQMASIVNMIENVSPENATVLLLGESGTGKELAARAIHQLSRRSENNFIAFNCAALTDTLLESELFGHVKGAFTNAVADKTGRFEAADKGTIFLDEIGETSENFQVKLLRILQNGEFEKVGSSKTRKTDVRVIAATNKNLEQLVKEKKFREDLFYRLNVIKIELPPLRKRKEDIEILANHFLSTEPEKPALTRAVLDQLNDYEWKGNIRELESAIKRAVIFAKSAQRSIIKLADLPEEIGGRKKYNLEEIILDSLRERKFSHSSVNETAKELELSRTLVSENFRGITLKIYYMNNFDFEKTIELISQNEEEQVREKVKSKVQTFLFNIEKDVVSLKSFGFEEVRNKLSSKYKNLPQKFHFYMNEIIKYYLQI